MKKKYIALSVHDVSPRFEGEIKEIIAELGSRGYYKRSIGLVPNYGGEHELHKSRSFVNWLGSLNPKENEYILHGYDHFSDRRVYPNLTEMFKGEIFSLGEAEFQNLTYDEARERLRKGKDSLGKLGIKSRGFIPPCWITNPESRRAIKDEGFDYMISSGRIIQFNDGPDILSKTFFFLQSLHLWRYGLRRMIII